MAGYRMTRRGKYLCLFGLLHVALGVTVILQTEAPGNVLSLTVHRVVPPPIYGPASILGGLLAMIAGIASVRLTPAVRRFKAFMFGVLMALVVLRAAAHLYAATIAWDIADLSAVHQVAVAVVYATVAAVHLLIATWPEPPSAHALVDEERQISDTERLVKLMADHLQAQDDELRRLREQEGER